MKLVEGKPCEKYSGCARKGPYVRVKCSNPGTGMSVEFDARVDTGACITCVPRNSADKLGTLVLGMPLATRDFTGSVSRLWTYKLTLSLLGYPEAVESPPVDLERGVLLTGTPEGLIGVDLLEDMACKFDYTATVFSLEVISNATTR
jgi:predicted aspartyl protease